MSKNCTGNPEVLYRGHGYSNRSFTTLQGCTSSHTISPHTTMYTSCISATFKRKPGEGVVHDLTNHTSLSSRFIAYSGSIRRESGRGFHIRPRTMCTGFRDTKRAPGIPGHVPTASQPTPRVSATHGLQHTTNTKNYLQLLDRGLGWLRSRAGSYFRA